MSVHDEPAVNSTGEVDERDVRALTEYLTVLPEAPGLYQVVSQSGRAYTVDAYESACTCPDFEYHRPEGGCKHLRRVAFTRGDRQIPESVPAEAIDEHLGRHVDGESNTTRRAATDRAAESGTPEGHDSSDPLSDRGGADRWATSSFWSSGGESLGPLPAVTQQRESVEQGGRLYWRCEGCGRETIYGREDLVHTRACPRRDAD